LTSAVKEEIVALKNQIKQLKEACTRLEQENSILKQYATQETLMLLESRLQNSSTSSLTSHVIQQPIQQQQQQPVTFEIGYATSSSNDQAINVNGSLVAQQQHTDIQPSTGGQDLMTASFTAATTEHALNTNGYMLDQQKTAEILSKDRPSA
jgi:predicted RNase H-like nuclease (RuvC/YqgF family)